MWLIFAFLQTAGQKQQQKKWSIKLYWHLARGLLMNLLTKIPCFLRHEWITAILGGHAFKKRVSKCKSCIINVSNSLKTHERKTWRCFGSVVNISKIQLLPIICPGATDARFLRNKGIPAFGFSPINHSPMLLHNNDEYLEEHIFLKGIDIFVKMMSDLANFEWNWYAF